MNLPIKPPTVTPVELTILTIKGDWWTGEGGSSCSWDFLASVFIFRNLSTGEFTGIWRNRRHHPKTWLLEDSQSIIEGISFREDQISFTVPGRMDEKPTYTLTRTDVWSKWHVTATGTKYGDMVGTLPIRRVDGEAIMLGSTKKRMVQHHRSRLMSMSSFDDAKLLAKIAGFRLNDILAAYNIPHPDDAELVQGLDSGSLTRDGLTELVLKHPPKGPLALHRIVRMYAETLIADDNMDPLSQTAEALTPKLSRKERRRLRRKKR